MKNQEKEAIIQKAKDLGFQQDTMNFNKYNYNLPFGLKNNLSIDFRFENHITLDIENQSFIVEIRKIESPEDLENLFNAICPEK